MDKLISVLFGINVNSIIYCKESDEKSNSKVKEHFSKKLKGEVEQCKEDCLNDKFCKDRCELSLPEILEQYYIYEKIK